jgi:hypothetical protein
MYEQFFEALFRDTPGGLIELRAKAPNGQIFRGPFTPLVARTDALTGHERTRRQGFIAGHRQADHVFVGVATRTDHTSGEAANCASVPALFVDLDFKRFATEADARATLTQFPFPPSLVVHTGGGLHAYWCLAPAINARDPRIVPALKALARLLGGDPSATDVARCLRVPGTLNFKPEYGEPRPVVLEACHSDRRYPVDALLAALPISAEPAAPIVPGMEQLVRTLAPLAPMIAGCEFVRWCRDHPAEVSEPLWYALLSNLSRCEDGVAAAHELSRKHPRYSPLETAQKFQHALQAPGPITCARIRELGFTGCPPEGHGVSAPAALGLPQHLVATEARLVETVLTAILNDLPRHDGAAPGVDDEPSRHGGDPAPEPDAAPASEPEGDDHAHDAGQEHEAGPEPAAEAPDPAPLPWPADDLADLPWDAPPLRFHVDILLPEKGVVWIGAVPHAFKSLFVQYLTMSLAADRAKVAEHFAIHSRPRVLYLANEDSRARTHARALDILRPWGRDRLPRHRWRVVSRAPINLLDAPAMTALAAHCRRHRVGVLVIDTWSAASPTADPLNAKEQLALATAVTALADVIDGLVLVVDHSRKNSADDWLSAAELYGPVQKGARAAHLLLLRRLRDDPRRIEVFVDSKDLDEQPRFFLQVSPTNSGLEKFVFAGTVAAAADQARQVGQDNAARILAAVPVGAEQASPAEWIAEAVAKAWPATERRRAPQLSTIRRHLTDLVAAGRVRRVGKARHTRYWQESAQGPGEQM